MEISWIFGENEFIAETRGELPLVGDKVLFHDYAKSSNLRERDTWFKVAKITHIVHTAMVSSACARDEITKARNISNLDDMNYVDAAIKVAEQMSNGKLMKIRKNEIICGVQKAEVYLELCDMKKVNE